ncbi:MAG: GspE/PulE family protein [Gallionellaceae bacterium]|nr:GspE/PulE family protein [Gallionellaceae bacterium]
MISQEVIAKVHAEAARTSQPMLEVLAAAVPVPPADFVAQLAAVFRYPVLTLADMQQMQPAFKAISYAEAVRRECIVFLGEQDTLLAVIADPFNSDLLAWMEDHLPGQLAWHLAQRADIIAYLAGFEETLRAMDSMQGATEEGGVRGSHAEELSLQAISEDTSPVVKLVNSTLYDALKTGASDIHLESGPHGLTIKYRIDGVLSTIANVQSVETAEQVISRIKILAELDIAERRTPQDGRFKVIMQGREVDFRVSIMPSIFGEDAVLRILDKKSLSDELQGLRLTTLGYEGEVLMQLRRLAAEPYGMLLVTGPTGSGKTTTLYAMISEINKGIEKIVTIEDPVEYQLAGVLQIPVNEKKGLTFARGLRSILRHDPDKIMVGEVRDSETAEIAVQAALTGHLVFTTVHANNVFDVIGRFIHMGVDPYSFVSAVNAVLAQRLVRLNCVHCKEEMQPDAAELLASGLSAADAGAYSFMHGRGCGICRGSGYKGRKAISELLLLNDEIRELVIGREPIRRLKEAAQRSGTRFLRESALDLVKRGETTLEEINRVTFVA